MRERRTRALLPAIVVLVLWGLCGREAAGQVRAGVGVVDMTWNVGACSGQYCDQNDDPQSLLAGGEVDPYLHHRLQR